MGCCNDSNFTTANDAELDPSERVAYSFGMVLGVDDFKQEHAWLAGRDQRALRETIGYGVVAGLGISVRTGTGGSVEIVVAPGLALGQDGTSIAVTSAQCARLDAWLTGTGKPSEGVSGPVTAYVVLGYADQRTTPVPIPGEPCRDEASQLAHSRVADGFTLELRWTAPNTEEDDALREWVAWLRQVPVQDAPDPGLSVSITEFQAAVQSVALAGPFAPPPAPPSDVDGKALVIPRARYTEYLSAAFEVWGRAQRLLHTAKFGPVQLEAGSGQAEPAVWLGRIEFTLDESGGLVSTGEPPALARVDTLSRPQVVHLKMLQEWLLSNAENDAPREAHYVLGRADARTPNAQDLYASFFGELEGEPSGHGPMARVDAVMWQGELKAEIVPAMLFDGLHEEGELGDYYGPNMDQPILVRDGGTGQASLPQDGQVLVGQDSKFTLGNIIAEAAEGVPPNLSVTYDSEGHNIVLDTVQAVHAGATPTFASVTLTDVPGALLATDDDGAVVAAAVWDGDPEHLSVPNYYAPGQPAPVRIQDGGTGLRTLPEPLQVLVGTRTDKGLPQYVLATLTPGENVNVTLVPPTVDAEPEGPEIGDPGEEGTDVSPPIDVDPVEPDAGGASDERPPRPDRPGFPGRPDLPGRPERPERPGLPGRPVTPVLDLAGRPSRAEALADEPPSQWQLVIDAHVPITELPVTPAQGGIGLQQGPDRGQILVGGDAQDYLLTNLVGARDNVNINVQFTEANTLEIDTAQNIDVDAEPTFRALKLSKPKEDQATHRLGWNEKTLSVVAQSVREPNRWTTRVIDDETPRGEGGDVALEADDQLLVFSGKRGALLRLPNPIEEDGRLLVFKSVRDADELVTIAAEGIELNLKSNQLATLIAVAGIGLWVVLGGGA